MLPAAWCEPWLRVLMNVNYRGIAQINTVYACLVGPTSRSSLLGWAEGIRCLIRSRSKSCDEEVQMKAARICFIVVVASIAVLVTFGSGCIDSTEPVQEAPDPGPPDTTILPPKDLDQRQ